MSVSIESYRWLQPCAASALVESGLSLIYTQRMKQTDTLIPHHEERGYTIVDTDTYYRSGVFRHFTEDAKCSVSMTARIDVTAMRECVERTQRSFYVSFVYLLAKVLNSRADYRMGYLWHSDQLVCWDRINPTHYVFFPDKEICTPVYTEYDPDYQQFCERMHKDIEAAKARGTYGLDEASHPNWFDASYIPWISYDSLNIELPDGFLYFNPIINWGQWREEHGALLMPVTVRLNHAVADGYLVAQVYRLLKTAMEEFVSEASSGLGQDRCPDDMSRRHDL